ncbi:MAG: SUMF1/EgtB/PvdO family nonheme iron enzyme [Myxococcota bacterium]|nr:SUMF1/EgtB/PvdO family nonheme iron enzyme [Myxococcota bacterium]
MDSITKSNRRTRADVPDNRVGGRCPGGALVALGRWNTAALWLVSAAAVPGCYSSSARPCDGTVCEDIGTDAPADGAPDGDADRGNEGAVEDDAADGDVAPDGSPCPPEMAFVPPHNVCIDRHEASQGPGLTAVSVAGVLPWTNITWRQAGQACSRPGKRLCTPDEWRDACGGPARYALPWGNEDRRAEYCNTLGIDVPYDVVVEPTGSNVRCEGWYAGVFDMIGNVAEFTDSYSFSADAGGRVQVHGGSAWDSNGYCDSPRRELPSDVAYESFGFRCCLSL